ncbi:hemicentin-2 isoform X1 [Ictalurus punctatus]|uniref:Hemicentin-2 isoform X1 n=1 Tax=Ictalurus punctatus TaxID=7998 RepID=A0A979EKZ3_ICTPU|nr:hemicentin-2 isoform X1 [Ictalurus punctatus]
MLYLTQLTGLVFVALINGEVAADCPAELNDLELDPPELVVRYGEPVSVSCRSLSNYTHLNWSVPLETVSSLYNQTVTWETDSLTDWEIQPECYMILDDVQCSKTLPLTVYKPPDRVLISTVGHTGTMTEGKLYELQCDIQNVAPVHLLTVNWYKGPDLVNITNFTDISTKIPVNQSTRLKIFPSRDDEGVQYSCEAKLNLGPKPSNISDPLIITKVAADCPAELNDLELDPPELVVRYGEPVSVSCRSASNYTHLNWSVPLGTVLGPENQTVTWETDNLTDWEIQPVCYMMLNDTQCSKTLPITVYKIPDQVSISIVNQTGPMTEGKKYELQCDIQNFAPVNVLAVSWYNGDKSLKNRGFTDLPTKTPSNKTVTLKVIASRDEGEAQYRCEAKMKLGLKGSQSPPIVKSNLLDVAVHSKPVITCSDWSPMINTTLDSYPYNVTGNPSPNITWYRDKSPVSTSTRLSRNDSGQYQYVASNVIGNASCVTKITVEYAPTFTCPAHYEGMEHESFLDKCSVMASPTADITWEKDGKIVNLLHNLAVEDSGSYLITAVNKHGTEKHNLTINVLCDCPVKIQPVKLVVEFGDSVSANCSTTIAHKGMGWEASDGAVDLMEDVHFVTWRVENLTHWDIKPICFININTGQRELGLSVTVYKHPDWVSISTVNHTGPMTEGREYELQCDVQNVAPVHLLTVNWYKGQHLVKRESFSDETVKPADKTTTLQISPSRDDDGVQYRCEAELNLGPEGPQPPPKVTSDPLNIAVHYKPVITCSDWSPMINTPLDSYPYNVTGNPSPNITWYRDKSPVSTSIRLSRTDSGQYQYVASNVIGNASCVTNITVEYAPTFTCPAHYEGMEHESFLDKCSVMASPAADITWEKDGKIVNPLHNLASEDSGSYLITAVNKHGIEHHKLTINVFCDCPIKIQPVKLVVEFGDSVSAICSTTITHKGMGWEASEEAVHMMQQVQNITWRVESLTNWDIKPFCYINVNSEQCELSPSVTVYKRPDWVSISTVNHKGPMIEGREYELQCEVQNVAPVHLLTVNWYKGQHLVKRENFSDETVKPDNKTTTLQISPSRDDDGVQYRCEAELNLGPEGPQPPPKVTSDPLNIAVHYKPVITCSDWSPMINTPLDSYPYNVKGNPSPNITWYRDKSSVSTSTFLSRNDSGQYKYVASNVIGNASCVTKITVEYAPTFTCPAHYEGMEHESFLDKCSVMASPAADITWEKDGKKVKPLHNLASEDSGSYLITAVNKHGTEKHNLAINVLYLSEIQLDKPSQVVNVGTDVSLSCTAEGNPEPEVTWSFQNQSKTTGRRQITLNVAKAKATDAGEYTCTASNKLGRNTKIVTLTVQESNLRTAIICCVLLLLVLLIIVYVIFKYVNHRRSGTYNIQANGAVSMALLNQNNERSTNNNNNNTRI